MIRKATRRTADVDPSLELEDLGLDWKQDETWEGEYTAILPAIPGYTQPDDPYNYACVYPVNPENPLGWEFNIRASNADAEINLYSADFGLPLSENAGDAMATVGDIPLGALIEAFENPTSVFASASMKNASKRVDASRHARHARYAVKRNAYISMSSWVKTNAGYFNLLPPIPGYQNKPLPAGQANEVYVAHVSDAKEWVFDMSLPLANGTEAYLDSYDFGFGSPFETAEDAELAVEHLDIQDIADVLQAKGYMPDEDVTASRKGKHMIRKAEKRIASLDLDWERDEEYCRADLPAIPGYSGGAIATLTLKDTEDIENPWNIDIIYYPADSAQDPVTVDCWSILGFNPDTVSYWSLMNAVDELDVNAIGDALNNLGVEPDED